MEWNKNTCESSLLIIDAEFLLLFTFNLTGAVNQYILILVAYPTHTEVNALRPRQMANILQICFQTCNLQRKCRYLQIQIQMCCPSYFCSVWLSTAI